MIPFILGAIAAVGLSELSKRGKMPKMADGGEISHYKVGDEVFIDYIDAVNYCDKHNLPYSKIVKTKKYAKGGQLKNYKYVPVRNVESVELTKGKKVVDVDGADVLSGVYVKKGKYAKGGGVDGGWASYEGTLFNMKNIKWHKTKEEANERAKSLKGERGIISRDSYEIQTKYAKGGGVGYNEKFEEVADFGYEQYYIRKWGKVSTDKKDNVELLAVATITDLEEYISESELPKEGNFQLDITLVPTEKHISKKHKSNANDDSVSMGENTIVNVVNYMGGLNYQPQEKVFFKTFDEAHKYLMSKELNDKISAQGMMSGFILDKAYNRIGQKNWDYLAYMMGEIEMFAKGGGVNYKKDWEVIGITINGKKFKKVITLGRMSDKEDVKNALKRMQSDDFRVMEVTSIKEL